MKTALYFAGVALLLTSCSNNQQANDKASQARVDSMSQELMRRHIVDSMNSANVTPAAAAPAAARQSNGGSYSQERAHTYTGNVPASSTATAQPAPVTSRAPSAAELAAKKKADRRKVETSAAEGALIGGGAGAIGGAIAGKNDKFKKQDAAIGGGVGAVLGAGAGYLIEKHKLKKDSTQH